jgi:hypothetical protein
MSAFDSPGPECSARPRSRTIITQKRAGVFVALAFALSACSGKHVRMVNPDTTRGPRYTCHVGGACNPATFEDEARLNPSGTKDVPLPRECGGKIQKLVVLDADSSAPRADVTCGLPSASHFACNTGATTCQLAPTASVSGFDVPLPAQCQGRIHRVVILNVDSASAEIDVACAPPEPTAPDGGTDGGIDEM